MFLIVLSNVLTLLNPLMFGNIINGVIDMSVESIKLNIFYMILIFIISSILNYIYTILLNKFLYEIEIEQKNKVFDSILNMPYVEYKKISKGKLIMSMENDSSVYASIIRNNINLFMQIINLIVSFVVMVRISPILTIIALLTLPITSALHIYTGNKLKLKESQYKNKHDEFITFLNESFDGWLLKYFQMK